MAVVYFTSNASTGAGSLVEAIKNASPGDVVRPDETAFERGSTIEIVLASSLTIDKNLTLDASPFRVALNGDTLSRCCSISNVNVVITAFDVVGGGWNSQTESDVGNAAGAGIAISGASEVTLNRCRLLGCRGTYGGGLSVGTGTVATLNDCIITGCFARGAGAGFRSTGNININGSTIIGNASASAASDDALVDNNSGGRANVVNSIIGRYSGNVEIDGGCVSGVAPSAIGFVAPPPNDFNIGSWNANAWQNWDLRLLDDASSNPSPYRDAGDVGKMTQYDADGNFRGRETNDVATCSPGAFETLQADLFWVGRDATGAEVVAPSFLASDGWAASRFAETSGDAVPASEDAIFVGETVSFVDAPPSAARLAVGAPNVVITGAVDIYLTIGATRSATVGWSLAALKLGDFAELTPSTSLAIPAVEFGGENVAIDNISVEFYDGVIFAAAPRPAAITTIDPGGWSDTTVGVSSLNVEPIDAQTVTFSVVKNDASKAVFAQYSSNDGATWQTVATTADVDEYLLTVPQGADVTVRVATATGWLTDTVSTAPFLPVWTVQNAFETVVSVASAFEVVNGGSNDGLNDYDFEDYGYL